MILLSWASRGPIGIERMIYLKKSYNFKILHQKEKLLQKKQHLQRTLLLPNLSHINLLQVNRLLFNLRRIKHLQMNRLLIKPSRSNNQVYLNRIIPKILALLQNPKSPAQPIFPFLGQSLMYLTVLVLKVKKSKWERNWKQYRNFKMILVLCLKDRKIKKRLKIPTGQALMMKLF